MTRNQGAMHRPHVPCSVVGWECSRLCSSAQCCQIKGGGAAHEVRVLVSTTRPGQHNTQQLARRAAHKPFVPHSPTHTSFRTSARANAARHVSSVAVLLRSRDF